MSRKKRLTALALVAALLMLLLGASTYRFAPPEKAPPPPPAKPKYPFVDNVTNAYNFPLTTGPRPSAETHVAVNPRDPNNIVVASNDMNNPSQDVWLHYYTTKDGGKTWSDGRVPGYRGGPPSVLTGFGTACDPSLGFDMNNNVYLAGVGYNRHTYLHTGRANCIFVARSSNGGDSFDQVSIVHTSMSNTLQFNDKEWLAVDLNNGNVYVTWTIFVGNVIGTIVFSRSTDQGRTWTPPKKLADVTADLNAQGSFVAVDRNSTIHVVWRDFSDDTIHYTRSRDYGDTWEPVRAIAQMDPPPSPLPNSTYRVPTMPVMAIDNSDGPYGGSIYLAWNDDRLGDSDVFLTYSRDLGDTWSESYVRVNNDEEGNGADQFFPAIAISEQGWVHLMFYDRRYDPNHTLLGVTYAVSVDGGQNFTINLNVSDTLFNGDYGGRAYWTELLPGGDVGFVGDYLGIGVNNRTAFLTWCDCRNATPDDGNSDIYAAMVVFAGPEGSVNDTYNYLLKSGS
ncbi:MAG: sialidase family protein [Thermoplasmata archaeon]